MKTVKDFKKNDKVVYKSSYGKPEFGVVSSINEFYVFVKYHNPHCSILTGDAPYTAQATRPEELNLLKE